ncbi:hypothetical protein D5086_021687 [Populus alba]|uniref:Uncharacterized protein n=1 Tax=Populus alba TaxID=43335 RepID=A0ACC4BCV9_POPAL
MPRQYGKSLTALRYLEESSSNANSKITSSMILALQMRRETEGIAECPQNQSPHFQFSTVALQPPQQQMGP